MPGQNYQGYPSQGGNRQGGYNRTAGNNVPMTSIDVNNIKFGKDRNEKLFAETAEQAAKDIAVEKQREMNKSTQLRKFYDELVMWYDRVHTASDKAAKYTELAPFIKMMCAKVAYAQGRKHVSAGFEKLFTHVIKNIKDVETLRDAKLFMEAFMGFYKALGD
jgi:CRISPR-associated protein Csm2